jgi:cbb3-type cytochrome oxidase subunit 3
MEITRVIVTFLLFVLFVFWVYNRSYYRGYERGATAILNQWKESLNKMEDDE